MSCQQVPTTPALNPYPRSVQVGEFEVAIGGGIWVAIRDVTGDVSEQISQDYYPLVYSAHRGLIAPSTLLYGVKPPGFLLSTGMAEGGRSTVIE